MNYPALLPLAALLLPAAADDAQEARPDRYVQAVRAFADVALQFGRDTYGPRHTPLFVDGLHFETHEPVRWKARDGHA